LREYGEKEHDYLLGIFDYDGKMKAYYDFELKWRFSKAGFRNIKIGKVLYSWGTWKKAGQKSFAGEEEPWDWYVSCER
jgi:hypothetical protein